MKVEVISVGKESYEIFISHGQGGYPTWHTVSRARAIDLLEDYRISYAAFQRDPSMKNEDDLNWSRHLLGIIGATFVVDVVELPFELTEEEKARLKTLETQPA
ncbi:hypothetical protein AXE65_12085 [Ventosimonas gracilis]|uniref:Uncharacterized protein n=1 Tax=Ventosimonas gracilis TaxID=1680762 RepID=A0A139SVZ2_9GAMM|nr:hypothetical protein [Ventosimonas gracilis]KXU38749.1 hypothetical protein AXE65_12085 [Ventosimonas gracilis]